MLANSAAQTWLLCIGRVVVASRMMNCRGPLQRVVVSAMTLNRRIPVGGGFIKNDEPQNPIQGS